MDVPQQSCRPDIIWRRRLAPAITVPALTDIGIARVVILDISSGAAACAAYRRLSKMVAAASHAHMAPKSHRKGGESRRARRMRHRGGASAPSTAGGGDNGAAAYAFRYPPSCLKAIRRVISRGRRRSAAIGADNVVITGRSSKRHSRLRQPALDEPKWLLLLKIMLTAPRCFSLNREVLYAPPSS